MEEEKKHMLDLFRRIGGTTPNQVSPQKPFKKTSFHKCVDSSVKYRNMGNKVFREPRHDAKSHMQIWRFYSYSIAHAPPGSDHLALGYANRSALLLHLRKFEECIRDVDRTLKITKCCELKAKLLCRKTECLVALQDGKQRSTFEKAKYWFNKVEEARDMKLLVDKMKKAEKLLEANEGDFDVRRKEKSDIDCKNDAMSISYNEKYGRHWIAKRDIRPGEFVCVDKFYVASANGNKNFAYCHHCLAVSWATVSCDRCAHAMYCSETCKQEAWDKYHDIECTLNMGVYSYENYIIQMSIRALIMGYREVGNMKGFKKMVDDALKSTDEETKSFSDNGTFDGNSFKCFLGLSHFKELDENKIRMAMSALLTLHNNKSERGRVFVLNASKRFIDQKNAIFISSLLLRLISIFLVNSFNVREDSVECRKKRQSVDCILKVCCSRGLSCSFLPSFFNHSCDYSVSRFYTNDGKVVYYAVQPIKKGTQIFTSYYCNYITEALPARRHILRVMFEVNCDCLACKKKWPHSEVMMSKVLQSPPSQGLSMLFDNVEFLANFGKRDHRYSQKKIENIAKKVEVALQSDIKPSFTIQSFIHVLVRMMDVRYGTILRIPNKCRKE